MGKQPERGRSEECREKGNEAKLGGVVKSFHFARGKVRLGLKASTGFSNKEVTRTGPKLFRVEAKQTVSKAK